MRYKLWPAAIQVWQDNFWFGAGPAHFEYQFQQHRPKDPELQVRADQAHNDYLNTLADWGLVGALLVAGAWGAFYWGVFRSWKFVQRAPNDFAAKRSNKSSVVLGGSLGLLAMLLHSFVDFNMHIPSNAILAVTLMALVSGYFRFRPKPIGIPSVGRCGSRSLWSSWPDWRISGCKAGRPRLKATG